MAAKGVHMRVAHGEGRCSVTYSADGKQLITSGADTLVKIFDAGDFNAEPRNVEGHHDDAVTTLAINAKGKFFATGTKDHKVSYFSYPAGDFQKLLVRLTVPIRHLSFDKTGRTLAVASDDAVIRLVNVGSGQYLSVRGHTDSILCIAFDPQGEYLASSSADGTVKIWDISDEPKCIETLQVTGKVPQDGLRAAQLLRIAWHPTGESLAVPYPEGVHVLERGTWNAKTRLQGKHTKEVTMASWSPNGRYLCSAGLDKQVFLWDLSSGEDLDRYKVEDAFACDIAWSPLANTVCFTTESGELGLWQQPVPAHLPAPFGDVEDAAVAPVASSTAVGQVAKPEVKSEAVPEEDLASEIITAEEDTLVAEVEGAAASGGGLRRRLRKVTHDSDDGGFSDHDDDEAAEAALLAAQLKRHGKGGAGAGASGMDGRSQAGGFLSAAGGAHGGAELQDVLHPSSTPKVEGASNGRRFLLWNLTGMVLSRDEQTYSAIEVDFNNTEQHRTLRLTDRYGFSMAALDGAAVIFGSRSNNGNPSTVVYRPLASWAPNSEWQVQFEKGEEAQAVALGHKFAAVATSARYLRVYSHTGAQRALLCFNAPLVAMAASHGLLALVQHDGRANGADQSMQVVLFDMRDAARPVRLATAPLPLSPGATLHWVGFSEAGGLATVDSAGVVRQCMRANGFEWVPVLHCAALKKSAQEHHWVVGLTDAQLMCVICKGDDAFPATLPRPVLSSLPLTMPLACAEPFEPKLEGERLMTQLLLDEYRAVAEDEQDDGDVQARLLKGFTKLDGVTIKLMQHACRSERNARALDLATQLQLPKALQAALKIANHYKMAPLAERITMLLQAKFDDTEVEVEAPPPRAAAAPRAKPAPATVPTAPAAAAAAAAQEEEEEGADADDEEDAAVSDAGEADTAENAPPQAASKPSNPFAKMSSGQSGKNVLELGAAPGTGPAGAKRKAVAPAAGKAAKKVA